MRDLNGGSAARPAGDMPDWAKQLVAALIPAGVTLLTRALTPTDPVQSLTQLQSVIGVARSLGEGGAAAKPDLSVELVRNAPGLLGEFNKLLGELRATETLRRANEQNRAAALPAAHNPAPVVNAAIHVPAAQPAPPTQPTVGGAVHARGAPQGEGGHPSAEWVFGKIYELISTGESGGYVLQFIAEMDGNFVAQMHAVSPADIKMFILNNPILAPLKDYPRLDAFIAELHAELHKDDKLPN
jgi:hypothetical protein